MPTAHNIMFMIMAGALMRLLATFTMLMICISATGQTFPSKKALTFYPATYIDTEARYTDSTGIDVIIQNSLPKWGTPLLDSVRKEQGFSSLIFFSRIINETNTPLELTINFSSDSFPSPGSPDAYLKLFFPSDTMTLGKEGAYSYGLTSLESLFDPGFKNYSIVQRTINPKQASLFYVVVIFYQPRISQGRGFYETGTRARFVLEEQNLFYKINQLDFALIPCGRIVFKN
jgi:hypothetical protein